MESHSVLGKTYLNLGEKSYNHKKFEASYGVVGFFPPPPLIQTPVSKQELWEPRTQQGRTSSQAGALLGSPASPDRRARGAREASQPSRRRRQRAGTRLPVERGAGASRGQRDGGRPPGYPSTASRAAGTQTPHPRGRVAHRPPPHSSSPPLQPSFHPPLPPYGGLLGSPPAPALRLHSSDTAAAAPRHPPADAAISPRGPGSGYLKRKCHCVSLAPGFRLYEAPPSQ